MAKYKRWILLVNWASVLGVMLTLIGIVIFHSLYEVDYMMQAVYQWAIIALVLGMVVHLIVALAAKQKNRSL